jgi:uncharacterized membrane protein YeaQ/YmgE (transglycosylase-associated protein family)
MRRRLYFVLPDVKRAKAAFNELLLSRIEERHIHFLARQGTSLNDLPEATMLQKSDEIHGLWLGLIVGGLTGALAGVVVLTFPPSGLVMGLGVILITSIIGAIMGLWVSGMIATGVPNTFLERFAGEIERGKILMMVDVPKHKVEEITDMIREHHPHAAARGRDPSIPAFP